MSISSKKANYYLESLNGTLCFSREHKLSFNASKFNSYHFTIGRRLLTTSGVYRSLTFYQRLDSSRASSHFFSVILLPSSTPSSSSFIRHCVYPAYLPLAFILLFICMFFVLYSIHFVLLFVVFFLGKWASVDLLLALYIPRGFCQ